MRTRFAEHIAWVTGAGSGIGRAVALELAREGCDVAVSGRRAEPLAETVRQIETLGRRALALPCDVRDEDEVSRVADRIAAELGRIDVAVANAGFGVAGRIEDLGVADWHRQLDTNVIGAALTAKHALRHLRQTNGRLALVGSVAAFVPIEKNGAYVASKAALRSIGLTLAVELAGSGTTCTTLHPGFVENDLSKMEPHERPDPEWREERPHRLLWPTDRAARVMVRGIHRRTPELVFTAHGKVFAFIGQHFPGLVVLAMSMARKRG
ncbi:MAG: SDR family NAD(P)-dependent oxidoreductase [Sandaracinaceae bacterium]